MPRIAKRTCTGCHKQRALDDFIDDGGRRTHKCNRCVRNIKRTRKQINVWDVWRSVHTEALKRLEKWPDEHAKFKRSFGKDPDTVRVLAKLQRNSCPLTGYKFHCPETQTWASLGSNTTLTKWRTEQPEHFEMRTPVLVRVIRSGDWGIGNVMLIAYHIRDSYERCSGLAEWRKQCKRMAEKSITIIQKEDVSAAKQALMRKRCRDA